MDVDNSVISAPSTSSGVRVVDIRVEEGVAVVGTVDAENCSFRSGEASKNSDGEGVTDGVDARVADEIVGSSSTGTAEDASGVAVETVGLSFEEKVVLGKLLSKRVGDDVDPKSKLRSAAVGSGSGDVGNATVSCSPTVISSLNTHQLGESTSEKT